MKDDLFTYSEYYEDKTSIERCDQLAEGKVIVPDGVRYIERNAFKGCIYITEIVLPNTVESIGCCAFMECISLETINIPENIKILGDGLFCGCISLKEIYCHNNIKSIGFSTFTDCRSLRYFPFSDNITNIGSHAFSGCKSLESLYISKNMKEISASVFSECSSIETVEIPANIDLIRSSAFEDCYNLRKVVINSCKVKILSTAFSNCTSLSTVSIASNPEILLIGFRHCKNIRNFFLLSKYDGPQKLNLEEIRKAQTGKLRYMALYYRLFGMNLTQTKWNDSVYENIFMEPLDRDWKKFYTESQSMDYIMSLDWMQCEGIGVILGYNLYRALQIDITSDESSGKIYPKQGIDCVIDEMLDMLDLPQDYPWVIRSGSRLHIIFRCEDSQATSNIDTISYIPNKIYTELYGNKIYKIELQWNAHLVLPPSIDMRGNYYRFRNGNLPTSPTNNVNLNRIESLIYKYCSEIQYRKLTYNKVIFDVAENKKINGFCKSEGSYSYNVDTIEWLQQEYHEEESNILAIKLLLGKGIPTNKEYGIKILKSLDCQTAKFNLLNLNACGFLELSESEIWDLYNELDIELFDGHLDLINEYLKNKDKYREEETYILFDTETTGLPKDYMAPASNNDNWPRLVQLSWIMVDSELNIISENDYIIKPDGFDIPLTSSRVHGITNEIALQKGHPLNVVLQKFISDLKSSSKCIGHNIEFDKKVVASELLRNGMSDIISEMPSECTMKAATNLCKIRTRYGDKYPKLEELYMFLFNSKFADAHNAMSDIKATLTCYRELKRRGVL